MKVRSRSSFHASKKGSLSSGSFEIRISNSFARHQGTHSSHLITSVPSDYTEVEGLAFIKRQQGRLASREGYAFVIANRADDRAIGAIGVWIRNIDLGRAALGYWLGSSARGRGTAAAALLAVSDWALENLEIVRLELFVEEWNIASWRTAEKAGFIREGLLRKWELIGGEWKDLYVYSKVREFHRS